MASTFTGQRCEDCSGSLEYDKTRKMWICPYCGREYERDLHVDKVQIDGVAGINDVVRATLSDITKYDFVSALKNLSECEKLNPNHVGTIICNICYYLFSASQSTTKDEMQKYLAKTTYYSKLLNQEYREADQDEIKLYDYCNNPDIYAILYIAYNSIGNKDREQLIYKYVQLESIVEPKINKSLLTISIKKNIIEDIDAIINKINFIDKKFTLNEILKKFPDGTKKKEYIKKLFAHKAFTEKDEALITNYSKTTSDHSDTRFVVFTSAASQNIPVNLTQILIDTLSGCTDEESAKSMFDSLSQLKLKNDDVQIVLDYCLSKDCPNDEVAIIGLKYLKSTDALYQVDKDDIISFIKNKTYPVDQLAKILDMLVSEFKVQAKDMDTIVTYVLTEHKANQEERKKIIDIVLKYAKTITIKTIEDYVLKVKDDETNKPEIIENILKMGMNINYFNTLLSKYMNTTIDRDEIRLKIILLLLKNKLTCLPKDFTAFLLSFKNNVPEQLLEQLKAYNITPDSNTLIMYFNKLKTLNSYDKALVDYLLRFKMYANAQCIERYVLQSNDETSRRKVIITSMLNNLIDKNFKSDIMFNNLGNVIKGNLAQAYLLVGQDDEGTKLTILNSLVGMMKLSDAMVIGGKSIKFKKYIMENKNKIDKSVDNLCAELGVYKLFF